MELGQDLIRPILDIYGPCEACTSIGGRVERSRKQAMSLSSLEYQILEDCKADLEDFSALVSSIDYGSLEELRKLVAALTGLVNKNLLTCCRGVDRSAAIEVDVLLLPQYLSARKAAGEDLAAYPAVSRELSFMATDSGLEALRKEDRPLDKTED